MLPEHLLALKRRQAAIRREAERVVAESARLIEEAKVLLNQPVYPFPIEEPPEPEGSPTTS